MNSLLLLIVMNELVSLSRVSILFLITIHRSFVQRLLRVHSLSSLVEFDH
jgi:hypothetical protein